MMERGEWKGCEASLARHSHLSFVECAGRPSANGLCVASLILGIVSIPLLCVWAVGAVTAIVGLALGIVALRRMNRGEVSEEGRGMAIGGIVCSAIALALVVVLVVLVIVAASTDDALGLVGGVPS